ncbi:MAG: sulfotransferase [Coleofasciculaceae cyanobacterium]
MLNNFKLTKSTQPVFIFGMPRSGTTLLRLMLSSHPNFCIPPECLFFVRLEAKYSRFANISPYIDDFVEDIFTADERFKEWNIQPDQLKASLANHDSELLTYSEAMAIVYKTYLQKFSPEATVWGDKNPAHIFHIDTILKYFPGARLVLIVRDPRSVYASLKRNEIKFPGDWKSSCRANVVAVTKQCENLLRVLERAKKDQQFYTISYEKLVESSENELKGLCSWLGEEFNPVMLEFYKKNAKDKLVPSRELGWHALTLKPVAKARIDGWKDELIASELEALEALNQKNMEKLGYQCLTSSGRYRGIPKLVSDYLQHKYCRFTETVKASLRQIRN